MPSLRFLLLAASSTFTSLLMAQPAPNGLETNARVNPLGIARSPLSLSWHDVTSPTPSTWDLQIFESGVQAPIWTREALPAGSFSGYEPAPHPALKPAKRYSWKVRTHRSSNDDTGWSHAADFETGLDSGDDWSDAQWISSEAAKSQTARLPLFRRSLQLTKEVAEARLYASAQGVYLLHLNGQKVGDSFLNPGWTDYTKRIQVQTYDVTRLLRQGSNLLGAALGDGWYRGKVGISWTGVYGDRLSLLVKLRIRYTDGSEQSFVSDSSWQTAEGPLVHSDLQDGETYDARHALPAAYEDSVDLNWSKVATGTPHYDRLVPQPDEPVRATEVLRPKTVTYPESGFTRVDFGQNLVGVVRVRLHGKPESEVVLRYAEELYRSGPRKGALYRDNLRGAKAEDRVLFGSNPVFEYQPVFTQHGFRYVEIEGTSQPVRSEDIEAVVLGSDLPSNGSFTTSSPLLNQLISNVRWGQRGNFLSIPTDTPARDERLGWTGDIAVFSPTACRLVEARPFLSKWLTDVEDAQKPNGNLPAVVPQPRREFEETGVGWADAAIQVPYAVWRATGDRTFLRRHWNVVSRAYRFIHESATRDGDFLEQGRRCFFSGDWLSLEEIDRVTEHPLIATAYLAKDSDEVFEMANALGDAELAAVARRAAQGARQAFVKAYIAEDGSLTVPTQTVYAMALGMKLVEEPGLQERVGQKFLKKLESDRWHLRTGFLGTPWLLPALGNIGRDDVAMRLLLNEDYPSWGYEVKMGATTVWERWNSVQPDGSFGPVDMNSFNHYAYGAVLDWMYDRLAGLQILEPGYRRVRIQPVVTCERLSSADGSVNTPSGRLRCSWTREGRQVRYHLEIPAGVTAEFAPPGGPTTVYLAGNYDVSGEVPALTE